MSGTINVARSLWSDPTFRDSEISQREAWIWMIAEASWKPRTRRIDSFEINLKRAQLAVSTRFLAKAWRWSEPRVRRYLKTLENRRMIERVTDAGISVITICNYDKFQNKPRDSDAAPSRHLTRDRRNSDANENKGGIREKEHKGGGSARAREFEKPSNPQTQSSMPRPDRTEREMLLKAMGYESHQGFGHAANGAMVGKMSDMQEYVRWRDDLDLTWDEVMGSIAEVMASRQDPEPPTSFKYFSKAMQRLAADKARPPLQPDQSPSPRRGTRNDRAAEHQRNDEAFRETIRRVRSGEVQFGSDGDTPFGN